MPHLYWDFHHLPFLCLCQRLYFWIFLFFIIFYAPCTIISYVPCSFTGLQDSFCSVHHACCFFFIYTSFLWALCASINYSYRTMQMVKLGNWNRTLHNSGCMYFSFDLFWYYFILALVKAGYILVEHILGILSIFTLLMVSQHYYNNILSFH